MMRETQNHSHFLLAPSPSLAMEHRTTTSRPETLNDYSPVTFCSRVARAPQIVSKIPKSKHAALQRYMSGLIGPHIDRCHIPARRYPLTRSQKASAA